MPTAERILALKLISDVGDINKQMKGVTGRYKKMADGAKSWGKAFAASFVVDGIMAVGNALQEGIDGYRSGQRAADQLGLTWKNLGMDGSKLDATLQKVTDSTLRLGTSDDEAVKAFTQSIKFTRDYDTSLKHLQIAQDLVANGSAKDLGQAFKLIQQASKGSARVVDRFGLTADTAAGRVRELGRQVKGAADKAARRDPWNKLRNAGIEAVEGIIGAFVEGDWEGAREGLDKLSQIFDEIVFGEGGIVPRAQGIGRNIGTAISTGLDELAKVDLSRVFTFDNIGRALGRAVYALQTHEGALAAIGITALALGAVFHGAMFVASLFATAAAAVFAAPGFLVGGVVHAAVKVAALGLGAAFAKSMFVASTLASWAWAAVMKVATNERLLLAARGLGVRLGSKIAAGIIAGVFLADVLNGIMDSIGWPKGAEAFPQPPKWNPDTGKFEHRASGGPVSAGGAYIVGEHGPELLTMGAQGGTITPNSRMGGVTIVYSPQYSTASPIEAQRFITGILPALRRELAGNPL